MCPLAALIIIWGGQIVNYRGRSGLNDCPAVSTVYFGDVDNNAESGGDLLRCVLGLQTRHLVQGGLELQSVFVRGAGVLNIDEQVPQVHCGHTAHHWFDRLR